MWRPNYLRWKVQNHKYLTSISELSLLELVSFNIFLYTPLYKHPNAFYPLGWFNYGIPLHWWALCIREHWQSSKRQRVLWTILQIKIQTQTNNFKNKIKFVNYHIIIRWLILLQTNQSKDLKLQCNDCFCSKEQIMHLYHEKDNKRLHRYKKNLIKTS